MGRSVRSARISSLGLAQGWQEKPGADRRLLWVAAGGAINLTATPQALSLSASTFQRNTAKNGAAITLNGTLDSQPWSALLLANNFASNAGGAVYAHLPGGSTGAALGTCLSGGAGCSVSGNTAGNYGGVAASQPSLLALAAPATVSNGVPIDANASLYDSFSQQARYFSLAAMFLPPSSLMDHSNPPSRPSPVWSHAARVKKIPTARCRSAVNPKP